MIEHTNKKKATKKIISNINYDPVRIRELVFLLSDDRATNYNQWLELGWALHNIDPNSQELLDIWIDFSKKSINSFIKMIYNESNGELIDYSLYPELYSYN